MSLDQCRSRRDPDLSDCMCGVRLCTIRSATAIVGFTRDMESHWQQSGNCTLKVYTFSNAHYEFNRFENQRWILARWTRSPSSLLDQQLDVDYSWITDGWSYVKREYPRREKQRFTATSTLVFWRCSDYFSSHALTLGTSKQFFREPKQETCRFIDLHFPLSLVK